MRRVVTRPGRPRAGPGKYTDSAMDIDIANIAGENSVIHSESDRDSVVSTDTTSGNVNRSTFTPPPPPEDAFREETRSGVPDTMLHAFVVHKI